MYQVVVVSSVGSELESSSHLRFNFGPPVQSLKECGVLAKVLEWLWEQWISQNPDLTQESHPCKAVNSYEGCDLQAENPVTGDVWYLDEDNVWTL